MSSEIAYVIAGAAVFVAGLAGTLGRAHLFWKILGVNFMGSGVFLILIAAAPRLPGEGADPVPQAMVLTGIVVAAASSALALGMALRVVVRSGGPFLSEDAPGPPTRRTAPEAELPEGEGADRGSPGPQP